MTRCNAYGAENTSGHSNPAGGLLYEQPVTTAWSCPNDAVHRFQWVCPLGHHSASPVPLCEQHYAEFTGRASYNQNGYRQQTAVNMRRDVRVCPTCASLAPDCDNPDHQAMVRGRSGQFGRCGCREPKVAMRLVAVS